MLQVKVNFKSKQNYGYIRSCQTYRDSCVYFTVLRKKGLIKTINKIGKRRYFSENILNQLALISLGQAGGLSLDEIHAILSPISSLSPKINKNILIAKAESINITISHLKIMSKGLRHVANCSFYNHIECPQFQKIIKIVAKKRLKQSLKK